MFTPMSYWLESVMIALAFCCFTSCRAPARAMSGALPELASATSKRTVLPDCFRASLACETASRIDSAQLGVAIEPVRSISWPRTITEPLGACGASAAGLHAAAQNARPNKIRFISFSRSRCVGSRRGRDGDLRTGIARRRRFDLRGQGGGGEERERENQPARAAARGAPVIPGLPGKVLPVELHGFPRTANARRRGVAREECTSARLRPGGGDGWLSREVGRSVTRSASRAPTARRQGRADRGRRRSAGPAHTASRAPRGTRAPGCAPRSRRGGGPPPARRRPGGRRRGGGPQVK